MLTPSYPPPYVAWLSLMVTSCRCPVRDEAASREAKRSHPLHRIFTRTVIAAYPDM
jgi:hypothetical protein